MRGPGCRFDRGRRGMMPHMLCVCRRGGGKKASSQGRKGDRQGNTNGSHGNLLDVNSGRLCRTGLQYPRGAYEYYTPSPYVNTQFRGRLRRGSAGKEPEAQRPGRLPGALVFMLVIEA